MPAVINLDRPNRRRGGLIGKTEPVTLPSPFLLTVYKTACIVPLDFLKERYDQTEIRSFAGDAGPARPQDARARADAWMGHHAAHSTNFRRRAGRQSGIALSGAAAAGTAGLDRLRVGRVRKQPAGEVLQVDPIRAQT